MSSEEEEEDRLSSLYKREFGDKEAESLLDNI